MKTLYNGVINDSVQRVLRYCIIGVMTFIISVTTFQTYTIKVSLEPYKITLDFICIFKNNLNKEIGTKRTSTT